MMRQKEQTWSSEELCARDGSCPELRSPPSSGYSKCDASGQCCYWGWTKERGLHRNSCSFTEIAVWRGPFIDGADLKVLKIKVGTRLSTGGGRGGKPVNSLQAHLSMSIVRVLGP